MSAAAFGKALIDLVVNVIGDAGAKIELGETVTVTPKDSSVSISGPVSAAKFLARAAGKLGTKTAEEGAQLDQWLSLSARLAGELAGDEAKDLEKLEELNDALVSLTFLAGNSMTVADLALYTAVAPLVSRLTATQRFQVNRVVRHFDLVQNLVRGYASNAGSLPPKVEIDLNRPAQEIKREKKKPEAVNAAAASPAAAKPAAAAEKAAKAASAPAEKKAKEPKEAKAKQQQPAAPVDDKPDPSKIDFKVGHILSAQKHPDADSLYVEQIDVGEEKPRTVCSGLVKYIPSADELVGKKVVVIANLKPAKMRGIESQAMLLAAELGDTVELVMAPEGSKPGDRVFVEGYEGAPDAQLNPKHKRWEAVQPHLSTSEDKQPIWKDPNDGGKPKLLRTSAGPLAVPTLVGAMLR